MLKTGSVIAERYEILGKIGSGGMADVYKAKDHKLNRFVAVKVMKAEFNNDDSFVRKFRREAQAAAGLANPNIVNVFDVGEDNGLYYIVMELVEGITLKEYVGKKHKLSVREATSIAIQVCMGLSAAHAQGIVHRDIKPQNIIISTDGKVKVTDFGIARAASSNTISANAMGSVHYSSPEQVRGGYLDAKSDIYSLGITLYEMVTGRVPFDGETTVAIAIKHLQDEMDPPSKYTPDLPYSLEQIIYKCTQKSPDRRYNSVNEVIADLKHSLTDPDGHFVTIASLNDQNGKNDTADDKRSLGKDTRDSKKQEPVREKETSYEDDEDEDDYYDDDDGLSSGLEKAMTIGGFIIGAIIIVILIYFIGKAAGLFSGSSASGSSSASTSENTNPINVISDEVEAIRLLSLTREQAQAAVKGLSYGIKYGGEEASDEYPAGQICRQDPEPGTMIERNSTITFWVSSGKPDITIPEVVGKSVDEARGILADAGFTNVTTQQEASATVLQGNVISVSPGEGVSTSPSTQIVLTYSAGQSMTPDDVDPNETVEISSVRGLNIEDAKRILEGKGMKVLINYGHTDSLSIDDVMAMSVEPGQIPVGTTITLTVNRPADEVESANESAETSTSESSTDTVSRTWVCSVRLDSTTQYEGGAYRLTLVQVVNGENEEIVIEEGNSLKFPYTLKYNKGVDNQTTGDVYLYERVDGNYVRKAKWTVPFQAS